MIIYSAIRLLIFEYFQIMTSKVYPWLNAIMLFLLQFMVRTGYSYCFENIIREVITYQITKRPLWSPVQRYYPLGETESAPTGLEWRLYVILTAVGNGLSVFGSGSFGMRVSGSMLSFFFLILGHKYKSKHLWNLYWINLS